MIGVIVLKIETLILVAVWDNPYLFQGLFSITDANCTVNKQYLFSSQCNTECCNNQRYDAKADELDFVKLYELDNDSLITPQRLVHSDSALYVLKYALNETIKLLAQKPDNQPVYLDTHAFKQLNFQLFQSAQCGDASHLPQDIGFAATIDFSPSDPDGIRATKMLLPPLNCH